MVLDDDRDLTEEQRMMRDMCRIEKLHRDAMMFLHMDGTVDITRFKIVKSLFPATAGAYAGPEA